MFAAKDTLLTRPSGGGYQISRSLRFNGADSTKLTRTPSSSTSSTLGTFSFWTKLGPLVSGSNNGTFISAADSYAYGQFYQNTLYFGNTTNYLNTTAVFRDFSAWYHIVFVFDTTQATSTNRLKIYVNNVLQTAGSLASYPTQNASFPFLNGTQQYQIGGNGFSSSVEYYNGYMTEINFIDGQALTPSSFGATDAQTGVWGPKAYSGSYGTNGFYLNFSDNSNTTAATLGKDYSGNGNNWTPNNFSVTAGAGNDSIVDVPTSFGTDTGAGGTVRGNYATLNPLKFPTGTTLSNGNLNLTGTSATYFTGLATISPSSGNYYMEMLCTGTNNNRPWGIGVVEASASSQATVSSSNSYFVTNNSGSTVNYFLSASATALSTSSTWVVNDIISLAWNVDSGKFWVARNGVWYPSSTGGTVASNADVAAGNFATFSISYSANTNPQVVPAFVTYDTTAPVDVNFGQRPFAYTAPSGFKALCTQNLPTPTIGATTATQAGKFFNPVLYTGTGSSLGVTGVGFQPDLVWVKGRSGATDHALYDAVRGVQKQLESNTTTAETTETTGITAFGSDGFTTGALAQLNTSAATYVAWNWKANGSGSSNTAGSITSTVSASTTSGFSVVTYTGSGVAGTVGHGLGITPSMIIVKNRTSVQFWFVNHISITATQNLYLNDTAGTQSDGIFTSRGSSTFGIGTGVSTSANNYVAYCFAPIAGYSAFGSYTGNGSADGPFVFTGFRPAFIVTKRTDTSSDWQLMDTSRSTYNVAETALFPNSSSVDTAGYSKDFLSNGFKIRDLGGSLNASGGTYIYMAFASNPFKYSLAR